MNTTLTNDGERLLIFENFIIDRKLPKYTLNLEKGDADTQVSSISIAEGWSDPSLNMDSSDTIGKNKFYNFFANIYKRLFPSRKTVAKISVEEFFKLIKEKMVTNDTFDSDKYDEIVNGYLTSMGNANKAGQVALYETLAEKLNIIKHESVLFATGNIKTITEEQVIEFIKDSEKGIRIDWIKNFNRVIPEKIVDKKVKMDKLNIFDNYVVMHYDPEGKSWKETQEEINKRKDPIIFGVIEGVNKLYYVGDWIDEYCDLTIETFIEKYGKEAIEKNNISSKF